MSLSYQLFTLYLRSFPSCMLSRPLVSPVSVFAGLRKMSAPLSAWQTAGENRNKSTYTLNGLKRWSCTNNDLPSTPVLSPLTCAKLIMSRRRDYQLYSCLRLRQHPYVYRSMMSL